MPSNLFYSTQSGLTTRELAATLGSTFKKNIRIENGVYLGNNRIIVGRQEYQFQNTSGQTIEAGTTVAVQNIGRKAAAIYAPTDLPTGLSASGSSSATGSVTAYVLADHVHNTAYAQGGELTAYATTIYVRKMISFRG